MAARTVSVTANPTENSRLRPRIWPCSVSQSRNLWVAAAPSARTKSLRRWLSGTRAIAAVKTSTWSAAVFAPAFPGRSVTASSSLVLSHHTAIGWNPNPPLNVGRACSFSECAVTKVASTSSTMTSPRSAPAAFDAGTAPGWDHTCRRVLALARWTRANAVGVSSNRARHTVGAEATGPKTWPW